MSKRMQLNCKNNELDKQLTEENKEIIMDMVAYLRIAPISDIQVEEIRQDLLDMALNAQEHKEPLSQVFGEDRQAFCDDIISNVKHRKNGSMISQWLITGCAVFSIFAAIDIVFSGDLIDIFQSIRNHTKINMSYPITLGYLLNCLIIVVISFSIVYLICKNPFVAKKFAAKFDALQKPQKFLIGCLAGAIVFGYLLGIVNLTKIVLVFINIIAYCVLISILFTAYKIFSKM